MYHRHSKLKKLSAALLAILLQSFCLTDNSAAFATSANPGYAKAIKVHDGDTVTVVLKGRKEKVRLIGIDAPEIKQRPWGTRAKKHLEKLILAANKTVILEFDVEKRDKYGRLLCYIFTPDRKMLNTLMVKDGYAVLLTIPPNIKYVDELKAAQNEARQHGRGIWSSKGLKETPADFRKRHYQ